MINRTKVKESTQIKPGDNGDVLVMKDNAPEWSTPSDADLAKVSETDAKLAEKQDKLTAGDNIKIEDNVISANGEPTPIAIGTVTSGEVPMVSNSGTDTDVVLNFVLPKGDKGDKGDQGLEGPQGPVGAPFQIKKIYDSVEAMNADYSGSDVAIGEFVLIDTGNVEDPDNSKLYVKGNTQYDFVTDLSGAQGIQGPQGNPGTPAGFGNITATVDNTTGTPQVSVQADGPNTAKNISFSFTGLKGEKGEKGDPGDAGAEINSIAPLTVGTAPRAADRESVVIGDHSNANGASSVAVGHYSTTRGAYSTSVGTYSTSTDASAAVGQDATANGSLTVAVGAVASATGNRSIAIGGESGTVATEELSTSDPKWTTIGSYSVALGAGSLVATGQDNVVSFGNGGISEYWRLRRNQYVDHKDAPDGPATRRLINVTDPVNAQDAATKNYVDTQLTPINAKLQYVPENTNQVLSQIQTNVEKAQSAADAKVASITAGTGITVDDSNPTALVISTTGLATQSDLTALQTTVTQLQETVTQLQSQLNNLTLEVEEI